MTRRHALSCLGSAAGMALLAACQPAAPAAPTAAPQPQGNGEPAPANIRGGTTNAAQPATQLPSGGTLRVGMLGDLFGLDGHLSGQLDSLGRVYNTTVGLDSELTMTPLLAESYDFSSDAKTLKLNLRKGVQFHTGRELSSEDVVWNYNRLRDPKVNAVYAASVKPFTSLEAPDRYTVVIKCDDPYPAIGDSLQVMNIIDPVTFQQSGPTRPIGTGPYVFAEWVQGDHLRLVRNQAYWDTGKPRFDELVFQLYTDPQSMVTAFEAGTLDVANGPPLMDALRLQKAGHQVLFNTNSGTTWAICANATVPPTNNKLVRQALNYAIDRQRIVDTVLLGVGSIVSLPWSSTSPAYDAVKDQTYRFDLDRARALLGQSGVSDLAIDLNYPTTVPEYAQIGQIYREDLARIGVALTLKPTNLTTFNSMTIQVQYQGVFIAQPGFGQQHPGVEFTSPFYGPLNNREGFADDTYTDVAVQVYREVDPAKQKQVYARWSDMLLDESVVMTFATVTPRAVARSNVHGAVYNLANMFDLTDAWRT